MRMPKKPARSTEDLVRRALERFWRHGYAATSAADLVAATGVSRHGIYSAFEGKRALFFACFSVYQETVVTPAFAPVEAATADLEAIRNYFTAQIDRAAEIGLPGPGCFVANTMTELAAHDQDARREVQAHNARLHRGFLNALGAVNRVRRPARLSETEREALAEMLTIAAQGLWSMSRTVDDPASLHRFADTLLSLVQKRID